MIVCDRNMIKKTDDNDDYYYGSFSIILTHPMSHPKQNRKKENCRKRHTHTHLNLWVGFDKQNSLL